MRSCSTLHLYVYYIVCDPGIRTIFVGKINLAVMYSDHFSLILGNHSWISLKSVVDLYGLHHRISSLKLPHRSSIEHVCRQSDQIRANKQPVRWLVSGLISPADAGLL